MLSNVQVLTAGTRYDQERATKEGKPIPTTVVTLLLTPDDAEKMTLASEEGRIMLALRNPLDIAPTKTEGARMAALLGEASPPPGQEDGRGPGRREGGAEAAAAAARRRSTRSRRFAPPSVPRRRSVDDLAVTPARPLRDCAGRHGAGPACPGAAGPVELRSPEGAAGAGRRTIRQIKITAGRSTVMSTDFDITRIAVTNPAIADAVVVQPREMLIDGKAPAPSA